MKRKGGAVKKKNKDMMKGGRRGGRGRVMKGI